MNYEQAGVFNLVPDATTRGRSCRDHDIRPSKKGYGSKDRPTDGHSLL